MEKRQNKLVFYKIKTSRCKRKRADGRNHSKMYSRCWKDVRRYNTLSNQAGR